ncbi:MAG TPA: hypothetical protein VM370_05790 [Candidatus Thermoplasmatota archaeon]|nr:hypothetical protein [Candidatus Thermoplasmatota archaeon]
MRALLVLLILLMLAAPALAQTPAQALVGKYSEVYVIAGRVLDNVGDPVSGGVVVIELDQKGVKAQPLRASANCKGDFITEFNLRHVDPKGKAHITLLDDAGNAATSTTVTFDPFFRRSDAILHLDAKWDAECAKETNVWPVSASMVVRLLNRTEAYEAGNETFYAQPYPGIVRLRYETPDGNTVCPPHPQDQTPGACEIFQPDERGDVRYTFTLDKPFAAGGRVEVILQEGSSLDVPIDNATRLGVKYFEVTGQGAPAGVYDTPGFGVLALALAVALALVLRRR